MKSPLRLLSVPLLMVPLAFSGFGLLATLEPNPPVVMWAGRFAYTGIATLSVVGLCKTLFHR